MNAEMMLPAMPPETKLRQYDLVERVMRTGMFWTLAGIRAAIHGKASEASISARLRQMRKNGWVIERRKGRSPGMFEYKATRS